MLAVDIDFFESCGFYTFLYTGSVGFLLYLFCYVLRVKSRSTNPNDQFDVDDFIRRVTMVDNFPIRPCPN